MTQPEALREALTHLHTMCGPAPSGEQWKAAYDFWIAANLALEAHGAPEATGNWIGSIPAEESDEEFARQVAEMDGHQAQAVASSPEAAIQLRTRIEKLRAHLEAIRKGEFDESDPAEDWAAAALTNDDVYARFGVTPTASGLSADARSNETKGSGVGAEPPALTERDWSALGLVAFLASDSRLDSTTNYQNIAKAVVRAALSAAPIGVPANPDRS